MKFKVLLLAILASVGIVQAQTIVPGSMKQFPGGVVAYEIQSPENGIGYSHDFPEGTQKISPYYIGGGMGRDGYENWKRFDVAVKIDNPAFDGCKLLGLCAYYFSPSGDVTMWTSTDLWKNQPNGEIVDAQRWGATYECVFNDPVTLKKDQPIYVGYTLQNFNDDGEDNGIGAIGHSVQAAKEPGGLYLKMDSGEGPWVDMSKKWGNATIWIYIMPGEDCISYGLEVGKPTMPVWVATGDSIDVTIPVKNIGTIVPTEMQYEYDLNGQHHIGNIDLPNTYNLTTGSSANVMVRLAPATEAGEYPLSIKVTKINGHDNQSDKAECTGTLVVKEPTETVMPEGSVPAAIFNGQNATRLGNRKLLGKVSAATKINIPEIEGMKIVGAEYKNVPSQEVNNQCLWLSSKLGPDPDGEVAYGLPYNGDLRVLFSNPIEMPKGGIYAGYTVNVLKNTDQTAYPFHASEPKDGTETLFLNFDSIQGWSEYSTYGALELTLYVQGDLKKDALKAAGYTGDVIFLEGQPINVNLVVSNAGYAAISSLDVDYDYDGVKGTKAITLDEPILPGLGKKYPVSFSLEGIDKKGNVDATFTVAKVNGNDNACADNSVTIPTVFASWLPVKRPLMEEGTGVGCGWCPRGTLALHLMGEKYPDFIAAAYHYYGTEKEPMYPNCRLPWNSDYGFPTSSIDRGPDIDPMTGSVHRTMGIEVDYLAALNTAGTASLDLATSWSPDTTQLTVNTTATFAYVEKGKRYKIAYILTTDSLSHPDDPEWLQNNSYTYSGDDYKDDPIMYSLVDGSFDVNTYNHVVVDAKAYKGVTNSVPGDVAAGDEIKHEFVYNLADNKVIEVRENVNVIVLLLDNNNHVCNARIVRAGEATTSDPRTPQVGINTVLDSNNTSATEYYDLMGRRIERPQHGLVIMKQGNKVSKVII